MRTLNRYARRPVRSSGSQVKSHFASALLKGPAGPTVDGLCHAQCCRHPSLANSTSTFRVSADGNEGALTSERESWTQSRRIAMVLRISIFLGLVLGFPPAMAFAGERPVVVELFTSQGCSSCPPANAFLNEIARGRSDVLPLAFHVTYWDRLGWKDPFSLEAATIRQDHYGHRFGDGSYTPEMVVDGTISLVGSHRDEINAAIEHAKRGQQIATDLSVDEAGENVVIRIGSGVGRGRVLLIGFDHHHTTKIGRGENGGRTLANPTSFGQFVRSANGLASLLKSASASRKAKTRLS